MKDQKFYVDKIVNDNAVVNLEALDRYVDFCLTKQVGCDDSGVYTEKHHILPKSLYPDLKRVSWNIVCLAYIDHVSAHEMLCESLPESKSMFYAKFLMKSSSGELTSEMRVKNKELLTGDNNPSKRADVREKISKSKRGVPRPDMVGKKYFGASEEVRLDVARRSSETHRGTVPVRLDTGEVIKIKTDDPRYLSGELKCIIGNTAGSKGPTSNPVSKAKYHNTLQKRRDKFSTMTGLEIADHCLDIQRQGKCVVMYGKLSANYSRLFGFANLDWSKFLEVVGDKVQRLSKPKQSTKRLF